jgi:hypothetical protein
VATESLAGSLASATLADLKLAELYVGPATWVGDPGDGDAIKVVFERVDGRFETLTIAELRRCAWWRLGSPEHVLSIEALMQPALAGGDSMQASRRTEAIRAEQAHARARLAAA